MKYKLLKIFFLLIIFCFQSHYSYSDNLIIQNLKELESRLSGWQLEAFKKSYEYKKLNGISLLQKKLQEIKKNNNNNS